MQTSFLHPPFGFALFYLRGIAPKEVKSSDIYWGAIPWVFLQLILVAMLIFWPGMVTYWLDKEITVDLDKVKIELPGDNAPGSGDDAKDAGDAQKAQDEATSDIQKSYGGNEETKADPTKADPTKTEATPSAAEGKGSADEKFNSEVERTLKPGGGK